MEFNSECKGLKSVRREFSPFSVGIPEDQYSHLHDKAESSFSGIHF